MVVNQMVAVCCVFRQTAMVVCQMLCAKCCRQFVVLVSVRMRHRKPPEGRRYTEPLSARHFGVDAIARRKYNFVPRLRTHTHIFTCARQIMLDHFVWHHLPSIEHLNSICGQCIDSRCIDCRNSLSTKGCRQLDQRNLVEYMTWSKQ